MAPASNPPSQSQGERRARRCGVSRTAAATATPKKAMLCLLSMPTPATAPNSSQSCGLSSRTMRSTIQAQPVQKSWSSAFIVSMLWSASQIGATSTASAAIPWAKRRPPRSRAINPVIRTRAAPASAGSSRTASSDSPRTARSAATIAGKSGGMSTKPHARWRAQAR